MSLPVPVPKFFQHSHDLPLPTFTKSQNRFLQDVKKQNAQRKDEPEGTKYTKISPQELNEFIKQIRALRGGKRRSTKKRRPTKKRNPTKKRKPTKKRRAGKSS